MYFKPEKATIVATQKSQPLTSIRQMYVTVRRETDGKELSFWWVQAPPTIITYSDFSGNKAPEHFEKFWQSKDLVGKQVNLYNSGDATHTYMTYPE